MNKPSPKNMDVLVTGADQRQGLAVIRALGSKGLKVFAAGPKPNSLGFFSRYTKGFCQHPSPVTDKNGFVTTILHEVKERHIPVVFPTVESTVIALDQFREEFEGSTRLVLPPRQALHLALDKKQTLTLAKELDVPIPKTSFPSSTEQALSFADETGYPIVMKPRALPSFSKVQGGFTFKVAYAKDREHLVKQIRASCRDGIYPILQEYCPGVKVNQGVLFAGGEFLGIFQYKALREYPLTGGVTSLHISVPIDPDLQEWSSHLLKTMKWDGVAMIEYKVNEPTGRKVLMEVNGRFWAPQSAATKTGLNFPYALYRYIKEGLKEKMTQDYPLGKKNRYLRGDLSALWHHWQGHDASYLGTLPGKGRILWDCLKDFRPGVQFDVLDLKDPSPSIRELLSLTREYSREIPFFYFRKLFSAKKASSNSL